jgi:hypothetical protein
MTGGDIRFDLAKHAEERSINVFTKRPLDSKLSLSESRQKPPSFWQKRLEPEAAKNSPPCASEPA